MIQVESTCPKCGRHLVIRDGQRGEFLACPAFPACKYTEPCKEIENTWYPPSRYCEKCNHTGLIPLIKNGKRIVGAFVYCECHEDEPERYHPLLPGDIDYPVSYSFYRALCQEHNWPDPGSEHIEPTASSQPKEPEWSNRQWDKVQQLESEIVSLRTKYTQAMTQVNSLKKTTSKQMEGLYE